MKNKIYISVYAPLGGGWHTALHTAQCWQEHGYDVSLISFFAKKMPKIDTIQTNAVTQNNFSRFKLLKYIKHNITVAKWLLETKPEHLFILSPLDLVHINLMKKIFFLRKLKINYIGVTHLSSYRKNRSTRESFIFKYLLTPAILVSALKNIASCICLTKSTAEDIHTNYAKLPEHSKVIPPFLNKKYFIEDLAPTPDAKNILYVGRLSSEKNIPHLLKAFSMVSTTLPTATLTIVGDGPERSNLEALAKDLDINKNVHFVGMQNDITPYHRQARVIALTSLYEGFPMALAEGLASGLTAVTYDIDSGPSDMVKHGENGYLIENSNIPSLAEHLLMALNSPFERKLVRSSAQHFSTETVSYAYNQFLDKYFELN